MSLEEDEMRDDGSYTSVFPQHPIPDAEPVPKY